MGLLSRANELPWWMQQQQAQGAAVQPQASQPPMDWQGFPGYQPASAPQTPARPFATNAQQIGPSTQSPLAGLNARPLDTQSTPAVQQSRNFLGLGDMTSADRMQLAMSLMAAGAPGGGGWGAAAQSYGDVRRGVDQRQRQQTADARETTAWDWQLQDRQRQQDDRGRYEQWVASLPPDQQQAARVNPQAAYGAFMEAQQMANAPITPYQRAQIDLERRGQDISAANARAARRPEGAGSYWTRPTGRDAIMGENFSSASQSAQQLLYSDIPRLRDLFGRMIQYDAQGKPLPASMRMTVGRYMQLHPEERAAYEQIESAIWPLVQQRLEGLAPITQFELGQAIARTPSANWTPQGVMEELDAMERAARLTLDLGAAANDFAVEGGSYLQGRDASGRTWSDVTAPLYEQHRYSPGGAQDAPARDSRMRQPRAPGSVQPPPDALAELRRDTSARARAEWDRTARANGWPLAAEVLGGASTPWRMRRGETDDSYRARLRRASQSSLAPPAAREAARRELERMEGRR